ncbi:MAG: hypothetical protein ACLTNU_10765 [Coprobacillus cateniformis]|uniref:hypothetical protein n=1 Tax=Coprobacillus cateniformis TaxID=100884 RepID=UPI003993EE37
MEITSKPYLSLLEVFTKMNNVAVWVPGFPEGYGYAYEDQYINEKIRKGVIMATGTPLSNSMVELYVMQLYLQERRLHEKGFTTLTHGLLCLGVNFWNWHRRAIL